jgi:hypothetical protein
MKKLVSLFIITLSVILYSVTSLYAQASIEQKETQQADPYKALIAAQNYSFVAQRAVPLSMPPRQLMSDYELKITKDSIVAYLPYYGKTTAFAVGSDAAGFNFTAKNFKYTQSEKKKGGWNVKISFKDAGNVNQMNLNVSSTGYTSLEVTSSDRESISYNGGIQ